jgi:hypothetical protein
MDQVVDAHRSVLIGQVRQADASHKFDTVHHLLRGKHFTGPNRVVYLGDVAQACLAQLTNAETPVFEEHPGYNEQRWSLRTTSGDLNVHIASRPYWAWGLMTSGYLNIITLEGPLAERARLVLDTASALGQPPWEMAHQRTAEHWFKRKLPSLNLKSNEQTWRALLQSGRDRLNEAIEAMQLRCDGAISAHESDEQGWEDALQDDLHMARRALSEDNAPGVERALARLEAHLIQMSTEPESGFIPAPQAVHSDGSDVFPTGVQGFGERLERTLVLEEKETVPFVDLSRSSTNREEE